jgi:hypothetical protein
MLNRDPHTSWAAHAARQRPLLSHRWHRVIFALGGARAAAAAGCLTALALLPPALVFPVTATALVLAAVVTGLLAWTSPGQVGSARLILWDFAGALTLLGLGAALLGDPEQAVALIERDRM